MRGEMYRKSFIVDGREAWSIKAHAECDEDALKAEGLYEPGECTDMTLRVWCLESGYPLSELGLSEKTIQRIEKVNEMVQNGEQIWRTWLY